MATVCVDGEGGINSRCHSIFHVITHTHSHSTLTTYLVCTNPFTCGTDRHTTAITTQATATSMQCLKVRLSHFSISAIESCRNRPTLRALYFLRTLRVLTPSQIETIADDENKYGFVIIMTLTGGL